jgi:shikimate dehydrogenase
VTAIWPDGGPTAGTDVVAAAVDAFLAAELGPLGIRRPPPGKTGDGAPGTDTPKMDAPGVDGSGTSGFGVGAIGTTAPHAVRGRLLADAIAAAGLTLGTTQAFPDPDALLAHPGWSLGVVLSPWKRDLAGRLAVCSPSAAETGVVDTVLRASPAEQPVGVNTNSWAAQAVLELISAGRTPECIVLLGAGASARSVALAVRRAWPATKLLISARSSAAATELAAVAGADALAPHDLPGALGDRPPTIMVNSTTWGETPESETSLFPFPIDALLAPGGAFFDLNNRLSELQARALSAGCTVSSGTLMQRTTNAARAAAVRTILTQETS